MNVETIRNAIRRQPFVPFDLRLNDGRIFHVPHPEYIALSHREVYCIDAGTENGIFLEPVLIASLQHVGTQLSAPVPPKNGEGAP
jgi:hypothetical protein